MSQAQQASQKRREKNKARRRLRIKQIEARTGWSRQTIWRRYNAGKFPLPHFLGRDRCWFEDEIDEWDSEQMAKEDSKPRPTVNEAIASYNEARA